MGDGKVFVCLCHDVTEQDLVTAYRAGYTHPETLKRATGCFMGPCQGRHCASAFLAVYSRLAGLKATRPTSRPPVGFVRLGELAGEMDAPDPTATGMGG